MRKTVEVLPSFVAREGTEMPLLVSSKDWAQTPLGPQEQWSPSLRLAVDIVLSSGFPMALRWGPDFILIYNDDYRPILGEKHPWALGLPAREAWSEVWPQIEPLHREIISGQSRAVFADDVLLRIHRYKDRWDDAHFTLGYSPIPDPSAPTGIGGIFITAIEITERVETERQVREAQAGLQAANVTLQAERERFAQLFEQAPTFMAMLSGPDHVFTLANPGYMRLIGMREVLGRTLAEALPDAVEQGYLDLLDQVYRTGKPYVANAARYAFQLEPDGPVTERFLDFVYQPVRDAAGGISGIFVQGADVTERARADAALRELNATLEAQVAERTEALRANEEALRQAQKMEAIGQLTGGIAHDFNNLLAAMSGSLELLERRLAEGRLIGAERYITTAQEATRRASALTQRLLAFARRQTLDPKPVDLNRMIAGMADLINRTVGPSVDVEVVGAGGLWTAKLDPGQLESALLNLCINARDAMAPGGGKITIETANKWLDDRAARQRDLAPGQYVSLCVTDTGTGMSDDLITKIFDPFFTTKPLGYGTGLGLSMVYGFVRQSGGQVRVYSELGKGTTMCLYLPRHLGGIESEESLGHEDIDPGAGETVLVIDDEAAIRMLIGEVLLDNGYRVLESSDGPSGLKILESDARIDLLITDVGLPGGLNGRQVADAARVKRPDLKVLFITGFAENAILANGVLDHGMSVITKPFVMSGLANKVREIIGR